MTVHIDHVPTAADAETPQFDDDVTPEAAAVAGSLFWLFAGFALILLPFATFPGKRPLGWIQEPWSWPFLVLVLALVGGAGLVIDYLKLCRKPTFAAKAKEAFVGMGRSLGYAAAFLAFIGGVWLVGFTLAAILFMQLLYYMSGLRGAKWMLIGFAVAAGIVLAFRVGLGIWFPLPPLMLLFPDWVGNALGEYL